MSDEFINDRAGWLVDAVATATQNRMFLRGDPECDDVATDAIFMNGQKAMQQVSGRFAARIEALEAALTFYADPSEHLKPTCINGHDRCYGGASDECPYCEHIVIPDLYDELDFGAHARETLKGDYHEKIRTN